MASMRDIKRRKESVTSTSQITKAMKLVATVKLQKSKSRAEQAKPYFNVMYSTVTNMLAQSAKLDHPLLKPLAEGTKPKRGVVLISSNRGLAGGYNSNIVKTVTKGDFSTEDTVVYPVGKKGREALKRAGFTCLGDYDETINDPLFDDAIKISNKLFEDYEKGEINEIYLAYTSFKNTVKHVPTLVKLLPIVPEDIVQKDKEQKEESNGDPLTLMNYEPTEEEALDTILPLYVNSIIFGALVESVASENGARMQAMDSATSNAEEMIDKLGLQYNRARQSSITQELTEIVAGASAID